MAFDLKDYEPVEDRIKRFYKDNPDGRIITEIVDNDGTTVVMKASLYKTSNPESAEKSIVWATGFAEEVRGEGFVNKTSHIENCETSAIGRALANANYAGSKRASREEMEKVQRQTKEAQPKADNPSDVLITADQVAELMAIAKKKGATTKEEAISFINGALLMDDFRTMKQSYFNQAVEFLNQAKVVNDGQPF